MKIGDKVHLDGAELTILDIRSRNEWALLGRFEPKDVYLLGFGIIGQYKDGKQIYFYDWEVDE